MRDAIIDRVALEFYQRNIRVQQGENEEGCFLLGDFPAQNVPSFRFMLWNAKSAISAFVSVAQGVPPGKYREVLSRLNQLNRDHQWVKFILLEDENAIQAVYDFPVDYKAGKALDMDYAFERIGRAVGELVEFLVVSADEAYPGLMEILRS